MAKGTVNLVTKGNAQQPSASDSAANLDSLDPPAAATSEANVGKSSTDVVIESGTSGPASDVSGGDSGSAELDPAAKMAGQNPTPVTTPAALSPASMSSTTPPDLDSSGAEVPNYVVMIDTLGDVAVEASSEEEAAQKAFARKGIVSTAKKVTVGKI